MKITGKFALFLIFSIFSFSAYAVPGAGGRDKGDRPGGMKDRPTPDRSERSSFSGDRQTEKPSASRSFSSHAEPPARPDFSPDRNTAPDFYRPEAAPPEKIFDAGKNEPSRENTPEILYYRGSRILYENDAFLLQDVKTKRVNSDEMNLELTFNQSINPLSFSTDSILLDGESIPAKTKFAFNKKGDTIRIAVPARSENFNLTITALKSFDGTPLEPVSIEIKE